MNKSIVAVAVSMMAWSVIMWCLWLLTIGVAAILAEPLFRDQVLALVVPIDFAGLLGLVFFGTLWKQGMDIGIAELKTLTRGGVGPSEHVTQVDVEKALAAGELSDRQLVAKLRLMGVGISEDFPLLPLLWNLERREILETRISSDLDGRTRRYWRLADKEY